MLGPVRLIPGLLARRLYSWHYLFCGMQFDFPYCLDANIGAHPNWTELEITE